MEAVTAKVRFGPPLFRELLEGKIEPGRVFDLTTNLARVPDGYRAMNERKALKVMS